jgi:DNA-directed RNA polymerase subunit RPC12/RpoP
MSKVRSSSVPYELECSACTHEWEETAESAANRCPRCGAHVEKTSGHFRAAVEEPASGTSHGPVSAPRRPSGAWGWAEATQVKPNKAG